MAGRAARLFACLLVLRVSGPAVPYAQPVAPDNAPQAEAAQNFNTEQLDALLGPVALYPDTLLTQVLMASTFPLQLVQAARWADDPTNKTLAGDALTKALEPQPWIRA
jgi:2-polyprenyl-6-methoxyphenol hydroxylase-like FAD-dependent oxidoreductase